MKQLEKKDLVEGEIYIQQWYDYFYIFKLNSLDFSIAIRNNSDTFFKKWIFQLNNNILLRLATPEEKHWLEVCIAANSFISYEEAMKSFIPEYVECTLQQANSDYKLSEIYKLKNSNTKFNLIENNKGGMAFYQMNLSRFKPSTKEAYDAQFVVKELEFVLPKKWQIKRNEENHEIINNWMNNHHKDKIVLGTEYTSSCYFANNFNLSKLINKQNNVIEITFEQFKKYVLKEQLEEPKDKVLEKEGIDLNIGKIIRVESSEGAIYQLGDKITVFTKDSSNKGRLFTIKGFRWNNTKTNICAITELHGKNGIGLNKIELYSEPVVKELSLLEQAKLKYPIGTKVKSLHIGTICTITEQSHINYRNSDGYCKHTNSIWFTANPKSPLVYREGQWAEIVDDFVLPETWWITIENEKQLEIAKQYFSQYFNQVSHLTIPITVGYVENNYGKTWFSYLSGETKQNNPQITFQQFKQYVLHNGFKVGDKFGKIKPLLNHTAPYTINKREIIDLQYIDNQSVAFYKMVGNSYSGPHCRILTKNIIK